MIDLTETEKAYLAGLFDGEGSIGYYKKKTLGYHVSRVTIYNTDAKVMDWLAKKVNFGSVTANRNFEHFVFAWIVSGNKHVVEFLTAIRPYLIIKAEQADLLLTSLSAEQEKRGTRKRLTSEELETRDNLVEQLKNLKTSHFVSGTH